MSELCIWLCQTLIRMEVALTVGAVLLLTVLRFFPLTSPRLQRSLCVLVLLQGCMWFRVPLTVPTFLLPIQFPQTSTEIIPDLDFSTELLSGTHDRSGPLTIRQLKHVDRTSLFAIAFCSVWIFGAGVILLMALRNYRQFLRTLRIHEVTQSDWDDEWNQLKRELGVQQRVLLVVTENQGPLLCWTRDGYQMVVPKSLWATFSPAQRTQICRHELAHLQRGDLWMSLACHIVAVTHWMNPLAWLLVHRFDEAAEIACDEMVQRNAPSESCEYARTLLCLGGGDRQILFASQAKGRHSLAERIRRLTSSNPRKDSTMKKFGIAALLVGLTAANLVQLRTYGEEASDSPKNTTIQLIGVASPEIPAFGSVLIETEKRTDAVVSIHEVFMGLDEFESERQEMNSNNKRLGELIRELNLKVQDEVRRSKENGTEVDPAKIAGHQSKFQVFQKTAVEKKNQLMRRVFPKITAEIELYAKENKIRVVRAKPQHRQPSNVASQGNSLSLTNPTLILSEPQTGNLEFVLIHNSGDVTDGQSVSLTAINPNEINVVLTPDSKVEEISKVETGTRVLSEDMKKAKKEIHVLGDVARPHVFVDDEMNFGMTKKEIIYASSGDDFDITSMIIGRLNEKFEERQNATHK